MSKSMPAETFYWHDYETWGIDPSLDRPSQFAGLRTDADLNVIGEPLVIYCQPAPDMVPSVGASMVTGITPQKALAEGLPEQEFIRQIHAELAQPGTCGVGYNSIRFDDEFTRYTLYRNFFDPYAREWQNGNSRWDLIDVVRLCAALRPEGIEWPRREDGAISFRLELLTAANGLAHEAAHDALSDVEATIALARLIRDKKPKLYQYALGLRDKQTVLSMLDVVSQTPVIHVSGKIAASRNSAALMMPITRHPVNRNSTICVDLTADPKELIGLTVEQIKARLFVASDDLPEGQERLAIKEIHANKSPMIGTAKLLDEDAAKRLDIDLEQCRKHWQQLREAVDLPATLKAVFSGQRFAPRSDPDAMLYEGFFRDSDRRLMDSVRQATAEELASKTFAFNDDRLPELLFRYRARNFPASLSSEETAQWQEYCQQRCNDPSAGGSTTVARELTELAARRDSEAAEKQPILDALEQWYDQQRLSSG